MHASVVVARSTLLADGINLIKDDNVQCRVIALRLELLLSIPKQLANVLFRLSDVLAENFGAVYNLWCARVEHLSDLSGHECFSGAWRSIQKDSLDVRDAKLLQKFRRKHARCKSAAENSAKLFVEATDAHLLKIPAWVDDSRARLRLVLSLKTQLRFGRLDKAHIRLVEEDSKRGIRVSLGSRPRPHRLKVNKFQLGNAHGEKDVLVLKGEPLILLQVNAAEFLHKPRTKVVRVDLHRLCWLGLVEVNLHSRNGHARAIPVGNRIKRLNLKYILVCKAHPVLPLSTVEANHGHRRLHRECLAILVDNILVRANCEDVALGRHCGPCTGILRADADVLALSKVGKVGLGDKRTVFERHCLLGRANDAKQPTLAHLCVLDGEYE
eukprot:Opistho-2@96201